GARHLTKDVRADEIAPKCSKDNSDEIQDYPKTRDKVRDEDNQKGNHVIADVCLDKAPRVSEIPEGLDLIIERKAGDGRVYKEREDDRKDGDDVLQTNRQEARGARGGLAVA